MWQGTDFSECGLQQLDHRRNKAYDRGSGSVATSGGQRRALSTRQTRPYAGAVNVCVCVCVCVCVYI